MISKNLFKSLIKKGLRVSDTWSDTYGGGRTYISFSMYLDGSTEAYDHFELDFGACADSDRDFIDSVKDYYSSKIDQDDSILAYHDGNGRRMSGGIDPTDIPKETYDETYDFFRMLKNITEDNNESLESAESRYLDEYDIHYDELRQMLGAA